MKKFLFAVIVAALFSQPKATPDLIAPFTVDMVSAKNPFWDTIQITSYLGNIGTTPTTAKTFDANILIVRIDSAGYGVGFHNIPAGLVMNPGNLVVFMDTTVVLKGQFSVSTWVNSLLALGEGGGEVLNNVRSQGYNFHPQIIRDTVLLIDTLLIRDTLKIVQKDTVKITLHDTTRVTVLDTITKHDTIRVTLRDTVIKKDTVKYCPPTPSMAKVSARVRPMLATTVYSAVGQPVWTGSLPEGEYPHERLKQGLYLMVQGQEAHRFRVAYK